VVVAAAGEVERLVGEEVEVVGVGGEVIMAVEMARMIVLGGEGIMVEMEQMIILGGEGIEVAEGEGMIDRCNHLKPYD
jgi:hypothetical protein